MRIISQSLSTRDGRLFVEDCDCVKLADDFGTPLFVVSESHVRSNLRRYKSAFEKHWPEGEVRVMPSFKASPIIAVRRVLTDEGCGCDVCGPGELEGALRGGVSPELISVNGSIKDREIIRRAIDIGARIVLDSPQELEWCQAEGAKLGKVARVMIRIKPFMEDLDVKSDFAPSAEIRELTQLIKYGIPTSEVLAMVPRIGEMSHVEPVGIHVHMGRHSKKLEVWQSWVRHCVLTTKKLSDLMGGWVPDVMNFGGGFPSSADRDTDIVVTGYDGPDLEGYAAAIAGALRDTLTEVSMDASGMTIEIEPGRGLHSDTGVHLTTVRNIKEETVNRPRKWAEVDTSEVFLGIPGFNVKPPFDYLIANKIDEVATTTTDVVGSTCNSELLFFQVEVPRLERGDVIAFLNTGSYSEPMAANFNALPRPGTVLVSGARAEFVKRHETVEEVFNRDVIPERLR